MHPAHIVAKLEHAEFSQFWERFRQLMKETVDLVDDVVATPDVGDRFLKRGNHVSFYLYCRSGRDRSVALSRAMAYMWTQYGDTKHFFLDEQSVNVEHLCQDSWRHEQRRCLRHPCSACWGPLDCDTRQRIKDACPFER